mmetsp:Transcript_10276/g.12352  ORF Transcript_10276/g.12352 Transcript_10276/m.12352 type:complete len:217 (-) Transcript_10276:230-880(-)|eukprot:CAMPEP_0195256394 /NCGR_PEP_ID=MMETSP0706-20130129/6207_1 /TAXON_ID=33640 /ORGANISM="Asterionellopsis glacialis, Strain CCMP134" /LENGTH=216 /DNA_ID=CAMNT_0040309423 /DNA_START=147 /DNA_END=797 /DNA_ORIENTATION=+
MKLLTTSIFALLAIGDVDAFSTKTLHPSFSAATSRENRYSIGKQTLSMTRVSAECANLLNSQVTRELEASQLYLSASIWCEQQNLVGMAAYMLSESEEERTHALQVIDFASKRDVTLELEALEAPKFDWDSCLDVWNSLLDAEKANTQSLFKLADAAVECHDHALTGFLLPYHSEQVESEDHLETIISKVQDESLTPGLIRQLDTELGASVKASVV